MSAQQTFEELCHQLVSAIGRVVRGANSSSGSPAPANGIDFEVDQ